MARDTYLKSSLGTLSRRIKESRVLLVGAGGIGCELLKNLLLSGFGSIHIIDLDTIDLSNLNRQFLFRIEHIKKPKALVAKEVAHKFQPSAELQAYHDNIKDPRFNVDWFASFDIVFNALDNLDARRHVNHMCLAADVPLIESGTTGFNGQVQVIVKGQTECYDCNPKEVPKSFPVCTIRSTPSQPIHCIVWAKSYLFPELFGTSEDDTEEVDHSQDSENAAEIQNLRREAQALKDIRQSMGSGDFARKVFEKVFKEDIKRLRAVTDMWKPKKSRDPPEPLDFDKLHEETSSLQAAFSHDDQKVWSVAENFAVFKESLERLSLQLQAKQREDASAVLHFDKDDSDALDFVTAGANLRAIVFGIEQKSKFDTKQMAGNIIPAIATTNAMTAGLCVLQAYKVMKGDLAQAKMVFLERSGVRAINSDTLQPPNPKCPVCSVANGMVIMYAERATVDDLVQSVLRAQLGYSKELSLRNELGTFYDPDLDDNLPKKLFDLGVKDGSFITVVDEDDQPRVDLELVAKAVGKNDPSLQDKPIVVQNVGDIPRKPSAPEPPSEQVNGAVSEPATGKRKRDAEEVGLVNGQSRAKRERVADSSKHAQRDGDAGDGEHPIVLGGDDEAILIDD